MNKFTQYIPLWNNSDCPDIIEFNKFKEIENRDSITWVKNVKSFNFSFFAIRNYFRRFEI